MKRLAWLQRGVAIYLAIFAAVLLAPLLVHRADKAAADSGTDQRLVVITPADTDIRNEFRWAFSDWHLAHYGQRVTIEYLTPGGTTDVKRLLAANYSEIRALHGGNLPPEDRINLDIQVVWGGGDYFIDQEIKPLGILRPLGIDPKFITEVFPSATLGGVRLYDKSPDPLWVGVNLDSFGICFNPDLCKSLGVDEPKTWLDLTDPRYHGSLALADPTHSATAAIAYMMILQRAMADAQIAGKSLDVGWKRGMGQLVLLAANARYFTDSSPLVVNDVAAGNATAGTAIDYYALVTGETAGSARAKFVVPANATAVTCDPVAILYGTHGDRLTLARHFVQFLLSREGQRIWILRAGVPGGPHERPLHRAPIRRDLYTDRTGWTDDLDYFRDADQFNEKGAWMTTFADLRPIWASAWIDAGDDLKSAYQAILAVPDAHRRAALLDELADIPIQKSDVDQIATLRKKAEDLDLWAAQQRVSWTNRFRDHYRKVAADAEARS